jgi:hypothetical protein
VGRSRPREAIGQLSAPGIVPVPSDELLSDNIHLYRHAQDRQMGSDEQDQGYCELTHDTDYLVDGVGAGLPGVVLAGGAEAGGVAVRG